PLVHLRAAGTGIRRASVVRCEPRGLSHASRVRGGARHRCADASRAERVAARLRAGAVHINGAAVGYGTPFGGYKQSGNGREGGMMGLEDYLETKTLHGMF
ncbi:MAG: aldehyde dehydrogenase family protein, partial [SAR116 cluster bacterium]|nr:aldehyde dehydrogenase family protein [SAR116 cluster bacterium]